MDEFDIEVMDPSIEEIDGGVLPVAILGTDGFDVNTIDPSTVELEGVSQLRWNLEDVATPVESEDTCECTTAGPDGFDDLTLKFSVQEIVAALGPVNDGEVLSLLLTANTLPEYGSAPVQGSDCVIVRLKGKPE